MTVVAYIRKGQTDMLYKGEHQTLTKQSMRHQACSGATCCTIISESAITMLMSSDKGICGVTYHVTII